MPKDYEVKKEVLPDGTEKVQILMKDDIIKKRGGGKKLESNPPTDA